MSQNCPIRKALNHEDSLGSSMFRAGGYREQTYIVTGKTVINASKGHFVTDISNAVSIVALVSGPVPSSLKHCLKSPNKPVRPTEVS